MCDGLLQGSKGLILLGFDNEELFCDICKSGVVVFV